MNIPIETFELHFNDTSILQGEKLMDAENVKSVSQVEKIYG